MTEYLVEHALANLWCSPDQDNQIILKPARITPSYGVYNSWNLMWMTFNLPEKNTCFHLYQIGQIHPVLLDLFPILDEWTLLSTSCNIGKVICNVYLDNGLELPRTQIWYKVTDEKNVVLAVKEFTTINFLPSRDNLYFRAYKNAYFNSVRSDTVDNYIHIEGKRIVNSQDIIDLTTLYQDKVSLVGGVTVLCNGYKIQTLSLTSVKIGDDVEFVYDSSINLVVDFKLTNLNVFDSTLDTIGKYLLHYAHDSKNTSIDYRDDVCIYLINGSDGKGIYYHKNTDNSLRMVTHRDYSIPVNHVNSYVNSHGNVFNRSNMFIRLHIHHSGYSRAFINEHNRIIELYKMKDTDINKAMLGLDSVVNNWSAATLENSDYTKIMSQKYTEVNLPTVVNAYGYNAVTKLVSDTPVKTEMYSSQLIGRIPYLFRAPYENTVFEYNELGILIGYSVHSGGELYNCVNSNCKYVEAISGRAGVVIDEHYNFTTLPLDNVSDYRFYVKQTLVENPEPQWEDVTGSNKYAIINNKFTWLITGHETLIRSNNKFLLSELSTTLNSGYIVFNITNEQNNNGYYIEDVMQVPMGELDIFLNGHYLIENFDYYLTFPTVTIVTKEHYVGNPLIDSQKILIRFTGLCDSNLKLTPPGEIGFVRNNVISNNNKYNIRDDKVNSIYINGCLYTKDELNFNEKNPNFELISYKNGQPYIVKDTVVPIKSITKQDTYLYRNKSLLVDKAISDYLTLKLPEIDPTILNPISKYYNLYSPFISKLIVDIKTNVFNSPIIKTTYDDNDIFDLIKPYTYLLLVDPTYVDNVVDTNYVIVHPHYFNTVISIDTYSYVFLQRVIKLCCQNLINLSPNVVVSN